NQLQRIQREQPLALVSRNLQAVGDEARGFLRRQRIQSVQRRNSLPQLRERRSGQLVGQRRLPYENDLQQLGLRSFEVRKQPHRLQHRGIQILRFVDHHNKAAAGPRLLHQAAVELLVHPDKVLHIVLNANLRQQKAHELPRIALGLKDERRGRCVCEFRQQVKEQRRLSHARP